MKIIEHIESTRNIGIIAHIDAGKTTVSERILYYTHKIHRMGEVHTGNATMDFMPEEQERGITIAAASTHCEWKNFNINLIDTPGHVDFTIEVERSLQVLDGAVGIFCAVGGVEPQSETVWKQSEALQIPKLAFINKLDRIGADFETVLSSMQTRLQTKPLVLQIPLGQGQDFSGLADLLTLQKIEFSEEDQGETVLYTPLEGEERIEAEIWREKLLEEIAELDDDFLEKYFNKTYGIEDIKESIRKIAIAKLATPVLMGSALKNSGIQPLLDAICDYLPSPLEAKPLKSEAFNPDTVKTLVFKVMLENNHRFSFVRIYNGILKENSTLYNINLQKHERIDHIYKLHADYHERVKEAYAGDLIGVIGMKTVQTGHTLSNDPNLEPYEDFNKYQPVISLAFEPKNSEEADILDNALAQYTLEDPTLLVNNEEGFRLVSGMGELHLSVLAERIEREYKIKPRIGNPQVILKESINNSEPIQASYRFERELGDKLHQGHAEISLRKRERGQGNAICLSEQAKTVIQKQKNISKEDTVKTVEDYCLSILESGNNNGLALADIEFTLVNILENENTSLVGIQNALHFALREAYAQAKVVTLYPIMKLEISVPEENLGAVMNLLNTCKAKVEQLFEKQNQKSIVALAPMQELFGFATNLRSSTQGRASLSMQFLRYDTL
ncbi:GTP-binding protein [Taurinivorans muris]|uniref:GTP-binding protein n=1 Tax=Taurinivorans muris TaxID=2787751 RepID=A0ABY5Y1M2_9BACT|nr:GTP-binding protein [Desulfovibrionaceae bacterium LT0009]